MENNVIEFVQKKPSFWQRTKTYAKQALGLATATVVVTHASAASSILLSFLSLYILNSRTISC